LGFVHILILGTKNLKTGTRKKYIQKGLVKEPKKFKKVSATKITGSTTW